MAISKSLLPPESNPPEPTQLSFKEMLREPLDLQSLANIEAVRSEARKQKLEAEAEKLDGFNLDQEIKKIDKRKVELDRALNQLSITGRSVKTKKNSEGEKIYLEQRKNRQQQLKEHFEKHGQAERTTYTNKIHKKLKDSINKLEKGLQKLPNTKEISDPASTERSLKLDALLRNCQTNILKHHGKSRSCYIFINFNENKTDEAKAFLKNEKLTSAFEQIMEKPAPLLVKGLYLSYAGYKYFGIREHLIPTDGTDAFKQGLMNRTPFGKNEATVEDGYKKDIHAMLMIAGNSEKALEQERKDIVDQIQNGLGNAFCEIGQIIGKAPNTTVEWFGFRDGISNPRFYARKKRNNDTQYYDDLANLNLALRNDILGGYPFTCGSFLVFMKLQQHQEVYEKISKRVASVFYDKPEDEISESELKYAGALLFGRHQDGTPLTSSETADPDTHPTNNFNYANDKNGYKCPLHAHVRKVNPREDDKNRRIVRRGVTYGTPESAEKGILFLAFQSGLERQFEYIANHYMRHYEPSDKDDAPDLLLSDTYSHRKFSKKWGESEKIGIQVNDKMITFKGGLYFFAPSISFFKNVLPNI